MNKLVKIIYYSLAVYSLTLDASRVIFVNNTPTDVLIGGIIGIPDAVIYAGEDTEIALKDQSYETIVDANSTKEVKIPLEESPTSQFLASSLERPQQKTEFTIKPNKTFTIETGKRGRLTIKEK